MNLHDEEFDIACHVWLVGDGSTSDSMLLRESWSSCCSESWSSYRFEACSRADDSGFSRSWFDLIAWSGSWFVSEWA